jgi:hypothetical protein
MLQSIEEHQEIPKGDAAVMPVEGPRKRHWSLEYLIEWRRTWAIKHLLKLLIPVRDDIL